MTLDYLFDSLKDTKVEITKALQTTMNNLLKMSVNYSNKVDSTEVEVLVEGKISKDPKSPDESFKHEFKLKPDEKLGYKCTYLKITE